MINLRNIIAALKLYHSRLDFLKRQAAILGALYETDKSWGQELLNIKEESERIYSDLKVVDSLLQRFKHENL